MGSSRYLDGRVAVVTGAGRGIFRAVALQMASAGASVVVVDSGSTIDGSGTDRTVADETVAEIRARGGDAIACAESVATFAGASAIVAAGHDAFGSVDVLVNGAGNVRQNMIWDMPEEDFDALISTHLKGTWNCMRAAVPMMIEQGSGSIVNTSSGVAVGGRLASTNYVAAKAGIIGLTFAAALDLGPLGVRVNAVCPIGYSRLIELSKTWQARYPTEPTFELPASEFPPEAVVPLVVYLAGAAASDVNGQLFDSGGGQIGWYPTWSPTRHIQAEAGLVFELDELVRRVPTELLAGIPNPAPAQDGPARRWRFQRIAAES